MKHASLHAEPCDALAEAGYVILDGEDGLAATLTPDAAKETGNRLLSAAARAADQRAGRRPPIE